MKMYRKNVYEPWMNLTKDDKLPKVDHFRSFSFRKLQEYVTLRRHVITNRNANLKWEPLTNENHSLWFVKKQIKQKNTKFQIKKKNLLVAFYSWSSKKDNNNSKKVFWSHMVVLCDNETKIITWQSSLLPKL